MKTGLIPTFTLLAAAVLAGCGGGDVSVGNASTAGGFRVVNGIPDSTGLSASLGGGNATESTGFGAVSKNYVVATGSYTATLSSNAESVQIAGVAIAEDQLTTLFGTGTISGTHGGFAAQESLVVPSAGQLRLQWVHAAYAESQSVPQFAIYLVPPGSGIASATPTTVPFGTASTAVTIAAGTYEIVITDPNSGNKVVFDSGSKGVTLPLTGSSTSAYAIEIAALDASGGSKDGSAISVLVLQNTGESLPLFNGQN